MEPRRKLIEVALPLEAINRESAHEKAVRHGHPTALHLWWARRPLATARAVLFAQLVDDPISHPDDFPTEELQRKERERLHGLISRLALWDSGADERLLAEAHAEILRSTNGSPPPILDPFAGGATIPLEAQRLGLEANASDLNPVAVLINKALVELPPLFRGRPPVFPGLAESEFRNWQGSQGLAADVYAYGSWMRDEAERRIGLHYPKAVLAGGSIAPVISWIWARTVRCPNPACRIELPLIRSWWLAKKKGKEAFAAPRVVSDPNDESGLRVRYEICAGTRGAPTGDTDGTIRRTGAICVSCETSVPLEYIREEGKAHRLGRHLVAVAAQGNRRRIYLADDGSHEEVARGARPANPPEGELDYDPRAITAPNYGMKNIADLFTSRQALALETFSDLVGEVRQRIVSDGGDPDYADAVGTYLAMTVSRLADLGNSLCRWEPNAECPRQLFGRQAIPMVWDFAEGNPLGSASGSWSVLLDGARRAFLGSGFSHGSTLSGNIGQANAAQRDYSGMVISTDPPYYDNVPYSSLSDFFYVWLRRSLRSIYPDLFATVLVPKSEELVANPFRQGGKPGARQFFETGFRDVFARARESASDEFPATVYYAFKQSDTDETGDASTGWETLLEGMIQSGWEITSTWPMRTETAGRMRNQGSNALASSIVLSMRPRPDEAPVVDRRTFISVLEAELPDALRKLQQGGIAPVDLPQAAIGPGMAVFSRYRAVIENDGSKMSVRSALARINEILDQVLSEQEGDFDPTSRFAIQWYRHHGYGVGKFGDADSLARARNTTVDLMDRVGILTSRAGNVQLIKPADLAWDYDVKADLQTSNWEALHHLIKTLERDGITPAGDFLSAALSRPDRAVDADLMKELGHLLFRVAEGSGWTKDALSFNNLVTSWPDVIDVAREDSRRRDYGPAQSAFEFDEDE